MDRDCQAWGAVALDWESREEFAKVEQEEVKMWRPLRSALDPRD